MFQNLVSKTTFQGFQFLSIFCFLFNNICNFSKPLILMLFCIFIKVLKNQGGLRIKIKKPKTWKRADQPQAEHQLMDILRIFLFNSSSIHCQKFLSNQHQKVAINCLYITFPHLPGELLTMLMMQSCDSSCM